MDAPTYLRGLIGRARAAQREFEGYPQERVDRCVRAVGKAVYDNAAPLARMAVDESRMGKYEDKILKNAGKPKVTWQKLKGVKSRGILRRIEEEGLVEIAKPMGVIGAITPITNPVMTLPHNAMIALKGGNAILFSPHPRGIGASKETTRLMREALAKLGAPEDLIQCVDEPTIEVSGLVMKMCDVCISTGGPGMVKAAYASGKPAFGVGPGNVQCLVGEDADIADAVPKIVAGRSYDYGTLCSCEQSLIAPASRFGEIVAEFEKAGAYVLKDKAAVDKLRALTFPDGGPINRAFVGMPATKLAELSGFAVPVGTKLLFVPLESYGEAEQLAREKLCPILSAFQYRTWEEAVAIANANLEVDGKGHSVVIHSFDKEKIEYAALNISVSRFSINQQGSGSLGGTLLNGLNPTATLGCGSWGGNSLSENLWWHHLVNISRIAYVAPGRTMPTDEEIWGED
jgi:succinate-semialdehyde dehydrogenase